MFDKFVHTLQHNDFFIKKFVIILLLSVLTWFVLRVAKKSIFTFLKIDSGRKFAFFQIAKYFFLVFYSIIVLQVIGINVSVILASSAALLVGLGLGIQHLFGDLVAGFIILVDATVKVGDIIELEGMISRVKVINLRTTTVETRDQKYIILPNSTLTNNKLINWTHSGITSRFEIDLGVDYGSDIHLVMKIIKNVAASKSEILKDPEPFVRLVDFGDSAIKFQLFFWTEKVFRVEGIKSEIRIQIFDEFQKNGIIIPFPQRTVHLNTVGDAKQTKED